MTTYHLIPAHDTWNLTREGNLGSVVIGTGDGPAGIHTKAQALINAGQYLNHLGEIAWLRVHNEDGSFEEELTYPTQGPVPPSCGRLIRRVEVEGSVRSLPD